MRTGQWCLIVSLGIIFSGLAGAGEPAAPASPKLWNGWGMTPTGQIVPLTNLANPCAGRPLPRRRQCTAICRSDS